MSEDLNDSTRDLIEKVLARTYEGKLKWVGTQVLGNSMAWTVEAKVLQVIILPSFTGSKWSSFTVSMNGEEVVKVSNPFVNATAASKSKFGNDSPIYKKIDNLYNSLNNASENKKIQLANSILDEM